MEAARPARRPRLSLMILVSGALGLFALIGARFREVRTEQAALAASTNGAPPEHGAAPQRPELARGAPARWQPTVPITGSLEPIRATTLGFKITGRLATVRVKAGDLVRAGERLATLDPAEARAQIAAATAGVRAAELDLAIAADNQRRAGTLFEAKAISSVDRLASEQKVDLARAHLEQARAQALTASVALEGTILVAPFAGLITEAPTAPGAIVAPGTALFRLEDHAALRLSATVSAEEASLLDVGAAVRLDAPGAPAGKLTAILPSADARTRRVPVLAEVVPDPKARLFGGTFVRATVVAARPIDVLRLPPSTLRPGSQDEVVVAREGRVHFARVVFARGEDDALLVRAGLEPADQVVVAPGGTLKEGDPLAPEDRAERAPRPEAP